MRGIRRFLCALCSLTTKDQILLKNMQELGLLPLLWGTKAAIVIHTKQHASPTVEPKC